MSRKYPKKFRKEQAEKLKAADAFTDAWMTSGLAYSLISDYSCTLTCEEAMTYACIFRAFKYPDTAEQILADHGEDCDNPHYHEDQGVWTFTLQPGGNEADGEGEYTIVADGRDGSDAEERAKEFLRRKLKQKYKTYFWIDVQEVEAGVPGSTALYSWTDIREAA
ncbi:hypothetical protein ACFYY2_12115 [Streptomyces sp. NPDC001822]|uniref:hypothetical protein n=1 Tax=Streptomyces sp. NPDC001822 TaxID=3364614 RepID=UPI0036840D98